MNTVLLGLPATPSTERAGAPTVTGRPDDPRLVDSFGRVATDLRVSLTDKCSLRCSYCMPAEGLAWLPNDQVLTDAEVIRLITVAVERLGVREVRFTGGEPLLRPGLEKIVEATARLRAPDGTAPSTSLTTNGIGLARRARGLRDAGLDRVNVSLDTLDRDRFRQITHRDRLPDVLAGLQGAADAGLGPIKVNAVLLPGVNADEAVPLLDWALAQGYQLRFIEQMPLDAQGAWTRADMVTAEHILAALSESYELSDTDPAGRGSAPARTWYARRRNASGAGSGPGAPDADSEAGLGTVGVIASVSMPFCGDCERTRLTADGQVRNCLFAREETDLRGRLRSGAGDEVVAESWRAAMWGKRAGHGIDETSFLRPDRPMSAIGG